MMRRVSISAAIIRLTAFAIDLGKHRTITGYRLCRPLACIFFVILPKFRLTGDSPPALNLYNLTKNLTAQSNDNNYAVLP